MHMNIDMNKKSLYVFVGLVIAVIAAVSVFVLAGKSLNESRDPKTKVARLMEGGVDTSKSLFLAEELPGVLEQIDSRKQKFVEGTDSTAQNLMDMARLVRDVRDYDLALQLFSVVDALTPPDMFYKIDVANIYLERQQWEDARLVLEPMRQTFPVREVFIGLAKAYQNIEGTPNYVIDEIYEEGLFRTFSDFAVLEEYVIWLEQTGREEKTLPHYELMHAKAPQQVLLDRINELKAKYQK